MSWDYDNNSRPIIYNHPRWKNTQSSPSTSFTPAVPTYFTWQTGSIWEDQEEGIKYINDTNKQIKIGSVRIKTCSCHSGGQGYWAFGGYIDSPCVGWGGQYYCYVMVSNDGGQHFRSSGQGFHSVPPIDSTNMNSPGSGPTNTAAFGNPPYTGYKGLTLHEYVIPNCPIIEPGGIAFVLFGIASLARFNNQTVETVEWAHATEVQKFQTVIRFILNPSEMEVNFDPAETGPYVWKFFKDTSKGDTTPKWHLVKPVYIYQGNTWKDIEEKS